MSVNRDVAGTIGGGIAERIRFLGPDDPYLPGCQVADYASEDRWLQARRRGIGASELAAVLGLSRHRTPFQVWAEKVHGQVPTEETERMRWGKLIEPVVASEYERMSGRTLYDPGRTTSIWRDVLFATLDRAIVAVPETDPRAGRGRGVLEVKVTGLAEEWEDGAIPLEYAIQAQAQMWVTGFSWGVLAPLIGGNRLRPVEIERNDAFLGAAVKQAEEWWSRYVTARQPPPVDGGEGTADALSRLYPTARQGSEMALPPAAELWHAERERGKAMVAEGEKIVREAEAEIKAALGETEAGVLPGGLGSYTWKTSERKGYTVEPTVTRTLRYKGPKKPR